MPDAALGGPAQNTSISPLCCAVACGAAPIWPMPTADGEFQARPEPRDICHNCPSVPFQNTLTVSAPDTAGDGCEPRPLASSVGP
jgi:hypothetical protein